MIGDRDRRYLSYIIDAIDLIHARISVGREKVHAGPRCPGRVLWRLQTLAEATGKLSQEVKDRHPEIRWRALYGFRNIAAHAYLDLNLDLVWEIVEQHLSTLRDVAQQELG